MDYIAGAVDTPLVVCVVDFHGGGRIICMLTDRELDEVRVGMPVEMSFRKLSGRERYSQLLLEGRATPLPFVEAAVRRGG